MAAAPLASILGSLVLAAAGTPAPIAWPFAPTHQTHPIANNFGEYQNYGMIASSPETQAAAYYHNGVDILAPALQSQVLAVADGVVTDIDPGSELYSCLTVGEQGDQGLGYQYCHLDPKTISVQVYQAVKEGALLGQIVAWPVAGFDHVHLSRVQGDGGGLPVDNPILALTPADDASSPVIEQASTSGPFLFCPNQGGSCLPPHQLAGEVDIVALIYDTFGSNPLHLAPYKVAVVVRPAGGGVPAFNNELVLAGELGTNASAVNVLYKDDEEAASAGDYVHRKFYLVLSRCGVMKPLTPTDLQRAWDTRKANNGDYEVKVTAYDHAGNTASASMSVTIANPKP